MCLFIEETQKVTNHYEIKNLIINEAKLFIHEKHFLPFDLIKKNLDKYTDQELVLIRQDFHSLLNKITLGKSSSKFYTVTAGGPSAGKSTALEATIDPHEICYIDPDRSTLFFMEKTYLSDLKRGVSPQVAYEKWRETSLFISDVILGHAFLLNLPIAHGATLTPPGFIIDKMLDSIKAFYGYSIKLLHITAPDSVRFASEYQRRKMGVYQCTDKDLVSKGQAFFKRITSYLKNFEDIDFYYRPYENSGAILVAKIREKQIEILHHEYYEKVISLHDEINGLGHFKASLSAAQIR